MSNVCGRVGFGEEGGSSGRSGDRVVNCFWFRGACVELGFANAIVWPNGFGREEGDCGCRASEFRSVSRTFAEELSRIRYHQNFGRPEQEDEIPLSILSLG